MTNKLKCPFCQQESFYTYQQDGIFPNSNKGKVDTVFCNNCKMHGNETIWQELIRTHKALGIALDWLREVTTPEKCNDELCREFTSRKLVEIKTVLEHKDVK